MKASLLSYPAPIFTPDGNYTFSVTAEPGDHLSLDSMLLQSNDWFYGLDSLPLFDAPGKPRTGEVTTSFNLHAEVDETPGYGPNQAPRQAGANTGPSENGLVTPIGGPGGHIHVTITPGSQHPGWQKLRCASIRSRKGVCSTVNEQTPTPTSSY